jgi:ABC-type multidrug transport system permease subunit
VASQIKQWFDAANRGRPELGLLISPSWLSGLLAVVTALAVVIGTVISVQYQGSNLQLLREAQTKQQQPINDSFQEVGSSLSKSQLISDIPLLILWGGVGFVVYMFTINLAAAFKRAIDFEHELDYVHADRDQMIRHAIVHAVFRFAVLVAWFLYLQFTLRVLLPYVVALGYAGAGATINRQSGIYLVTGVLLLALGIHLHTVLLRLVMLRPRIFGTA